MSERGWQYEVSDIKLSLISNFHKQGKILDLGCGKGWYSQYLADQGNQVTSVDFQKQFTHDAITFLEHSLEKQIPLSDRCFDTILAWDIIEHVENEDQLLSEIDRLLKVGGKILISVPHADDSRIDSSYLTYCHFKDKTHKREYLKSDLQLHAQKSHWKEKYLELAGGDGYPFLVLNFIENKLFYYLTKVYIKLLVILKIIKLKNCHGDVYAVFEKSNHEYSHYGL